MSARYFAGFPIGFNVAIGGKHLDGTDDSNELSYIFLAAQKDVYKRQDESRHTEGSGLGLSIAKNFMQMMNGEFRIEIDVYKRQRLPLLPTL